MDDSVNWAIMHDSCTVTMAMKSFFVLADLLCEKSTQLNEQWWWKVDWCFCSIIQNEVELFTPLNFVFGSPVSSLLIYIIFQTLKLNFYFKMWKEDANVEYTKVRWRSKYETNEPVASYWELRGCQKCEWSELKKIKGRHFELRLGRQEWFVRHWTQHTLVSQPWSILFWQRFPRGIFFLEVKVQKSSTSQKSWRIMSFVHTTIGGCIELESNIFVFGAIHSVSFIQHLFTHKLHYNKSTTHNKVNISKFSRALNIDIIWNWCKEIRSA